MHMWLITNIWIKVQGLTEYYPEITYVLQDHVAIRK